MKNAELILLLFMMKRIMLILLAVLFLYSPCFAAWYIISPDGVVRGVCSSLPNEQDLETRGEIAVFSPESYVLSETEYTGKKFKQRVKSSEEIADIKAKEEKQKEDSLIYGKMKAQAIEALKAEGKLDANGKIVK